MSASSTTEGKTIMMDLAAPKIAQLVAEARTELKRLGIDTEGKRCARAEKQSRAMPITG
jgi:hypothetical protein